MTEFRICSAHLVHDSNGYTAVAYNMFGREIERFMCQRASTMDVFIKDCYKNYDKFSYTIG